MSGHGIASPSQHPPASASFQYTTRHYEYYIPGGDLFFLVDRTTVFRVHRHFFTRESSYFRRELRSPSLNGREEIGTSDSNAVLLDDVRVYDFERFLWVFYNPQYDLYNASTDDWGVILRFAHEWDFPRVKDLAVRHLENLDMSDVDRISWYQSTNVDKALLVPWLSSLCARDESLTIEEGEKLGISTAMRVARAREHMRSPALGMGGPSPVDVEHSVLESFIRESFQIPGPSKTARPDEPAGNGTTQTPVHGTGEQDNNGNTSEAATPDPHRMAGSAPPLIITNGGDGASKMGVFGRGRGRATPSRRF